MNLIKTTKSITLSSDANDSIISSNFPLNSEFVFNIPIINLSSPEILYSTFSLTHCEFTNTIYNINETNNSLTIIISNTHYVIVVEPSNYTILSLIQAIKSHQYFPTSVDVQFNENTSKLIFTNNAPFSISSSSIMNESIGNKEAKDLVSNGNKIVCPFPVNLLTTKTISIVCNQLPTRNYNTKLNKNVLINMQLSSASFGEIEFYTQINKEENLIQGHIDTLHLLLYDDNNQLIHNNGQNFSITISFDSFIYMNSKLIKSFISNEEEEDVQIDNRKGKQKK